MIDRGSGLLMAALIVACTPGEVAPVARPPSPAPAPPPTEPAPVASSAPAPPAEPARLTPPPGVDPDAFLLMTSICAASYVPVEGSDQARVGCRSHPPFSEPAQKPDGALTLHQGDVSRLCTVNHVYHGAFTKPGVNQAVLSFDTCDDGKSGWGNAVPGSAVLVEERDGRWRAIDYAHRVNADQCLTARSGGRDVLLCQSGLTAPPQGTVLYFFVIDFAKTGEHARTLLTVYGDDYFCDSPLNDASDWSTGFTTIRVGDAKLVDVDKDGVDDWVLPITRSHLPPAKNLDATLKAACKARRPSGGILTFPGKKADLQLLRKGDRFVTTPATQKTLAAWGVQSSEMSQGLGGVAPPGAEE